MDRIINELTQLIKESEVNEFPIFFTDLDESAQKQVMGNLKEALNVAEDDTYAVSKIQEVLSKEGNFLFMMNANEVARRLNFDFGPGASQSTKGD
jgi:hypothetical protein